MVAVRRRLREIMRDDVSVVRSEASLRRAIADLDALSLDRALAEKTLDALTTRTMALLAREIATSALYRRESRGGHIRSDVPGADPALDGRHQLVSRQPDGSVTRIFGPLDIAWSAATPVDAARS